MRTVGIQLWFIIALLGFLQGCAAAGYVVSAAGAGHTQYKFTQLEERLDHLESVLANPPDEDVCK